MCIILVRDEEFKSSYYIKKEKKHLFSAFFKELNTVNKRRDVKGQ